MTDAIDSNDSVSCENLPRNRLELHVALRRSEALVNAKIHWKSSWPPVCDNVEGFQFPIKNFVGRTQTSIAAKIAEHRARRAEFERLGRELPRYFQAVDLSAPAAAEFQLPEIEKAEDDSLVSHCRLQIVELAKRSEDFWGKYLDQVIEVAFKLGELPLGWKPGFSEQPVRGEPSINRMVFPSFPIRSLDDLIRWLDRWIKCCTLPERPAPSRIPDSPPGDRFSVTIKVPKTRPRFKPPLEQEWRCSLQDLSRELRNCSRAFHAWNLRIRIPWEGEPPDHSTAEDRLAAMQRELYDFRQLACKTLVKQYSEDEIGQMHVPALILKLANPKKNPKPSIGAEGGRGKGTASLPRGRPKGSVTTNPEADAKIANEWQSRGHLYVNLAEFATEKKLSKKQMNQLLNRHRTRPDAGGNK